MRKLELDGLRAFAVLSVLYTHFWNEESWLGHTGVRLFFVLSGFLITGILLRARLDSGARFPTSLIRFYVRRALRIWPAYYGLLVALLVVNYAEIRASAVWHLLFLSNIWFVVRDGWQPWIAAHLWTLSMEEQFYLLWPVFILLAPYSVLKATCWGLVVIGAIFRLTLSNAGASPFAVDLLPPASFDALAAGALLAFRPADHLAYYPRWIVAAAAGFALMGVALFLLPLDVFDGITHLWTETTLLLPLVLIVGYAAHGIGGWVGAVLRAWPVSWLGRISYGIYLYHLVALGLTIWLSDRVLTVQLDRGPLLFIVGTGATIALAAASWFLLERPFNSLGAARSASRA